MITSAGGPRSVHCQRRGRCRGWGSCGSRLVEVLIGAVCADGRRLERVRSEFAGMHPAATLRRLVLRAVNRRCSSPCSGRNSRLRGGQPADLRAQVPDRRLLVGLAGRPLAVGEDLVQPVDRLPLPGAHLVRTDLVPDRDPLHRAVAPQRLESCRERGPGDPDRQPAGARAGARRRRSPRQPSSRPVPIRALASSPVVVRAAWACSWVRKLCP